MEPTLEKLDISDPAGLENWHERFDYFTDTDPKITASNRTSWYIRLIGKDTYDLVKVLAFPDPVNSKSVADLQALLTAHLRPTHYESTERARFHNLSRRSDETLRSFLLRIQRQAAKCNFGSDLLSQMRDRIVAGVNDPELQKRLLTVKKLTFEKAKEHLETCDDIRQDINEPQPTVLYNNPQARPRKQLWQRGQRQNPTATPPSIRSSPASRGTCDSCGGNHQRKICRFRAVTCHKCQKTGHIARVCRSSEPTPTKPKPVKVVVADVAAAQDEIFPALAVRGGHHIYHEVTFSRGHKLDFVVDTGSPITFLPKCELLRAEPTVRIQPTNTTITSVSGHPLPVLGETTVMVKGETSDTTQLKMIVTQEGPTVLGLDGLRALDVSVVFNTATARGVPASNQHLPKSITDLIQQCGKCTGGMKVQPVTLQVTCPPIFLKARPIAFNLRGAVEKNLQELVQSGILTPISTSAWGTPIVTPLKPNGLPRICGDFKVTVNPFLKQAANTTLPVEDMFAGLLHHKVFSKLDLTNAFLQIPLDESSKEIATIHTPYGLYRYNYLPFGLTVSSGEFQQRINEVIHGLEGTRAYQDDILVYGVNREQHNARLHKLLLAL